MGTVVAISRQFGSGGARIGHAVAQRLDFQYADRQILAEAARMLNADADELEPFEERAASFWTRAGSLFALGSPEAPYLPPMLPGITEYELFLAERRIIQGIAARGNAVIVGRGAAHVLDSPSGVVRIFLHAPIVERIELAMAEYDITDRDRAAAIVRDSDRARAQFVRRLTGRDWCDATLYDLSIDVAAVGAARAVDIVVDLVQRPPERPLPLLAPSTDLHRRFR